ncbi:MAG: hypothetical protein E7262_09655 [Lachnospiraceae bacterium]|nr:hypothetical protein [Lachnospiraceae bacterium]
MRKIKFKRPKLKKISFTKETKDKFKIIITDAMILFALILIALTTLRINIYSGCYVVAAEMIIAAVCIARS